MKEAKPCLNHPTRTCRGPCATILPAHAQDIFRSAFNAGWRSYGETDPAHLEEIAHRVAWAAVKKHYRKLGHTWVPRELADH